jgi:uncharacterized protein YdbL (DUF1318 family)
MKRLFSILCSAMILSAMASPLDLASAADADAIKNAMIARKATIESLKKSGKIGEDNKGYLAPVSSGLAGDDAATIKAENADRAKVYEAIAKKQGTTAALVGQRRATQIASQAKPGEYVQAADGAWKKK